MKQHELYEVEDGKLKRKRKSCPKCGSGFFLAEHKNRLTCGKCHYTNFKGEKKSDKPVEKAKDKPSDDKKKSEPEKKKEKVEKKPKKEDKSETKKESKKD